MKKTLLITLCLGFLLAGGMWAQQKAQIRIKKNVNGVESQETREVIIDENNSIEDVLRELNAGNDMSAAQGFLLWNRAAGKVMTGLTNRRKDEMALFLA